MRARWRRRRRLRDLDDAGLEGVGDLPGDLAELAIGVALVVAIVLLLLFGGPALLIGIDLAWLLLVGVLGLLGRVILRRPWRVEAVSDSERRSWFVPGYRAAGEHRDEIARQLEHGQNPLGSDPERVPH